MQVFILFYQHQNDLQGFTISGSGLYLFIQHFIHPFKIISIFFVGVYWLEFHIYLFLNFILLTLMESYSLCFPNHFTWITLYSKTTLATKRYLFPIILNTTRSSPTKLTSG